MSDRPHCDNRNHVIDVIEDSVVTDPQLPDRLFMLPWRDQSGDHLSVACLARGFVGQLHFYTIQDPCPLRRAQGGQIGGNASSVLDPIHLRVARGLLTTFLHLARL